MPLPQPRTNPKRLSSCREPSTLRGKILCSAHVERTDPARVTSAWGCCVVIAIHTNPKGLSSCRKPSTLRACNGQRHVSVTLFASITHQSQVFVLLSGTVHSTRENTLLRACRADRPRQGDKRLALLRFYCFFVA